VSTDRSESNKRAKPGYKELRQRYQVTIENPQPAETAGADNRPCARAQRRRRAPAHDRRALRAEEVVGVAGRRAVDRFR
jgi:hypothetical protein